MASTTTTTKTSKTLPVLRVFIQGPGAFEYQKMFVERGHAGAASITDADIVVFTGGEDVNPALYKEEAIRASFFNPARDGRDIQVYEAAKKAGKFMAGICRGGQFLNVMNGGRMWQDVNNHTKTHDLLDVETGRKLQVTSTHHQMMRPTSDAVLVAYAQEATVKESATHVWNPTQLNGKEDQRDAEVVWYEKTKSLCFQPHPEFGYPKSCPDYFFELLCRYHPAAMDKVA